MLLTVSDFEGPHQEAGDTSTAQRPQSNFLLNRRDRPPAMEEHTRHDGSGVPFSATKVARRESKFGLRGIFRRNRSDENAILDGITEGSTVAHAQIVLEAAAEESMSQNFPTEQFTAPPNQRPLTPPSRPTNKSSRMSLKPKSMTAAKSRTKSSPKRSTKPLPKRPTRTSTAWDPPPLFQAYPQAIKHATLSASTLSADSILRISNHQRKNSLRDEIAQTGASDVKDPANSEKNDKARSKHKRQLSGSLSKAEWTQKIFVLVTSGYLLQYAGEGSFDRLPEKIMQLGKDSVAFASDAILGKHWVLQISQAMAPDGTPASDSRSILSRLAFRGTDYRRTATSMLLVLNSAEDMDAWIAVVRREIEALGGKQQVSETGKPKANDNIKQLRAQPSHRYLVTRNPDQFSDSSPRTPYFGPPPWAPDKDLQVKIEEAASALLDPPCLVRPSTGSESISNSITSHDGRQLDSLRDSTHRLSYMSSGQRTLLTSQYSSPTSSPTRESISAYEETPKSSTEDAQLRPNASAINERRRSMQAMRGQLLDNRPVSKSFRSQSIYDLPLRAVRAASPPAPNFSVPSTSSRRYSTSKIPSTEHQLAHALTISTTLNREPMLKGHRKAPPAALSVLRQLSPVKDSPSPRPDSFGTLSDSPCKIPQHYKSPGVNRPRSRSSARSSTPKTKASRRASSFTSPTSIERQFPLHLVTKQSLFDDYARISTAPLRSAPPPPARTISAAPDSGKGLKSIEQLQQRGENEAIPPLPSLSTPKTKLRRPASMQIHTSSTSQSRSPFYNKTPPPTVSLPPMAPLPIPPAPKAPTSPSLDRLKSQSKALANRRSMPVLVNGPPSVPPPDCALPPIPSLLPLSGGISKSPLSMKG